MVPRPQRALVGFSILLHASGGECSLGDPTANYGRGPSQQPSSHRFAVHFYAGFCNAGHYLRGRTVCWWTRLPVTARDCQPPCWAAALRGSGMPGLAPAWHAAQVRGCAYARRDHSFSNAASVPQQREAAILGRAARAAVCLQGLVATPDHRDGGSAAGTRPHPGAAGVCHSRGRAVCRQRHSDRCGGPVTGVGGRCRPRLHWLAAQSGCRGAGSARGERRRHR